MLFASHNALECDRLYIETFLSNEAWPSLRSRVGKLYWISERWQQNFGQKRPPGFAAGAGLSIAEIRSTRKTRTEPCGVNPRDTE